MVEGVAKDFEDQQEQEDRDRRRRDGLVLSVTIRMVLVRRPLGRPNPDEADDVGAGVGEGVKAVGEDADRAAGVAEQDLGYCDDEIQKQDAREDAGDF